METDRRVPRFLHSSPDSRAVKSQFRENQIESNRTGFVERIDFWLLI